MRILYLSDYDRPIGGAELLVLRMRDGMRRRGHDARLLATSATDRGGAADYHCYGTASSLRGFVQAVNPFAAVKLAKVIEEFRPDVVHVGIFLTQLSPLILPVLRRVPSIYQAMWYRTVCATGTKLLPSGDACTDICGRACLGNGCVSKVDWLPIMGQMALLRRWLDVFDVVAPVSEAVKRELEAGGIRCGDVIPAGVEQYEQSHFAIDPHLVGFSGRLVKEKGVHVLLRAFAKVREVVLTARLLVIGDGRERESLLRLANALGLADAAAFTGQLPRPEVERRLGPASVQVICSTWAEPFGLVAPEAMLRGTAVVASRSGGLAEIVRDGTTGLLVPPGDVDALAAALTRLLLNPAEARSMGAAGRRVATEEYGETLMFERLERLYRKVMLDRARSGRVAAHKTSTVALRDS